VTYTFSLLYLCFLILFLWSCVQLFVIAVGNSVAEQSLVCNYLCCVKGSIYFFTKLYNRKNYNGKYAIIFVMFCVLGIGYSSV